MIIEKKYHFYSAHRNEAGGEKCGRIHGHTYRVKCQFRFKEINEGGITCLFSDIDNLVEPIIKEYCHWFLIYENDPLVEVLELVNEPIKKLPFITSAENLSIWLLTRIKNETGLPIIQIELQETESSKVIYHAEN
ncbi:COG0720 6-pyruvoyl-tetrahydropterin synthase [uncultured Caudovirales phage]|uniref:COG0720 6-pyruvoyl-tetrahydropterin synthase n=1 Tax=uncultured Caudovirales phage TaxID=2100421 RepID=A0A6J7X541_9CAUD|nr:COG0720 6-pyruvoyl-tetrahydropterin synthase [uncultured Caudovirales phage]